MSNQTILQPTAGGTRVWRFREVLSVVEPLLATPTTRSLLSLYLRCIRLDDRRDAADALETGIRKEIQATQQTTKAATLCYPMLSSYQHAISIPMHPDLPFRPFLNAAIHARLRRWRDKLSKAIYLPQCSFKLIGSVSADNLYRAAGVNLDPRYKKKCSTSDLEAFYSESGQVIEGPCEVRTAWKYSQLKPRVYYAIGASSYFAARYTYHVFDSLQRVFKATDPHHRFQFHRFPFIDFRNEVFMIYDYASFTSSLADFPRFVEELGFFLKGTKGQCFDSHTGMVEIDLGDLLHSYNQVCNVRGEFDVTKVVHLEDGTSRLILNHHVAGMLGVYGNITGSTALHGLVGMTIAGGEDRINTVGDDGAGIFDVGTMDVDETRDCLRIIGDISEEKFEVWEEDQEYHDDGIGWHFTKRPINVNHGNVDVGWMPDFPIYPVLLNQPDEDHTVIPGTFDERRRMAIRQSIRLMESMRAHITLVEDVDVQLVLEFLEWLFKQMNLPLDGSLPDRYHHHTNGSLPYPDKFLATPVITEESITKGWWQTLESHVVSETGYLTLPVDGLPSDIPVDMTQGMSFMAHGSKILGLLEKIGVVKKEAKMEDVLYGEESMRRLDRHMRGELRPLYEFHVVKDYIPWRSYSVEVLGL